MNKDEMLKDKEQLARIIAFELCPQRYHKELYGEESMCYSDNNFSDCIKIKEVVDKIYDEGYQKVSEDEFVLKQDEVWEFRKDQAEVKFLKHKIKQETALEILQELNDEGYKIYKRQGNTLDAGNFNWLIAYTMRKYDIDLEDNND